jgi:hypothetical protein
MKATIKKINELVYPPDYKKQYFEGKEDVNLEMLLVALGILNKKRSQPIGIIYDFSSGEIRYGYKSIIWQLNKTLTEQSEKTQKTIKNLFE